MNSKLTHTLFVDRAVWRVCEVGKYLYWKFRIPESLPPGPDT